MRFEMQTDADPDRCLPRAADHQPEPLHVPAAGSRNGGPDFTIVGSSPEALVTVKDSVATTHPIAGTRWRGATEADDLLLEKDLLADEKENSEHLMLVDLGRNDLGRVCEPGTVKVSDYRHIERYSHVMHLVSTVSGELQDGKTALDAVNACFPAGTLTGAPKVRAMELIDEHEKTRRGLYGGIVGYLDFAGDADTAIAIRTAVLKEGRAYVQAGGGVVADSEADYEYNEASNKARAVLKAIAAAETMTPIAGTDDEVQTAHRTSEGKVRHSRSGSEWPWPATCDHRRPARTRCAGLLGGLPDDLGRAGRRRRHGTAAHIHRQGLRTGPRR